MNLKILVAILVIVSASAENALLQYAKDAFSSNVEASKHCSQNLHTCHIITTVLGIMCIGLLIINIATMVFFNREALRYACGRMLSRFSSSPDSHPIVHHDEDDPYLN